jgi:Galactose oxidase, central domain
MERTVAVTRNRRATLLVLGLVACGSGLFVSAQTPQQVGTWTATGIVADGRVGAASVALEDGRTLVTGGVVGGAPTASVVVYDPSTSGLTLAGQLLSARVGHTATLLEDGRVLVAGGQVGDAPSADVEVFDPVSGGSTLLAQLTNARARHAAARVEGGSVVLFGGLTAGGAVLSSVERVDVSSGTVSAGTYPMLSARAGASATTLIDGRVLVAGGSDGNADLRSAELYDPLAQSFEAADTQLSVARSGHSALLLPHNNSVLIAGGSSAGLAQASADLFLPAEFPDPYSYGMGAFAQTGAMAGARAGAVGGPGREGYAWVDGGGADQPETYRFATIKTDKDDYAPGEHAVITGSGWQPGEDVRLVFQEDPAVHDDYVLIVTADAAGNIYHDQWAPEQHDIGVRFFLIASDSRSRAQITFTDAVGLQSVDVSPTARTVTAGATASYTVTVNFNGSGTTGCTTTLAVTGLPPGTTASFTPSSVTATSNSSPTSTLQIATTVAASATTFTVSATAPNVSGGQGCNGGTKTDTASLTIDAPPNAPPTVTLSSDATANEGQTKSYSFTTSDPDAGETFSLVTATCGPNGTQSNPLFSSATGAGSFDCTFPDGPASSSVSVQVSDGDASDSDSITVAVANVAPTVTLTGDATANEGETKTYTYTVTDPGADPSPTITESCGTGTFVSTATSNHFQCTFPDGPATSEVEVTANDGDPSNNIGTGAITVTIANVAPTVTLAGDAAANEGDTKTYTYTVTDPGIDPNPTITESCGTNGTFVSTATLNHFQCTFPDGPATSEVNVTANDGDSSNNVGTSAVTVAIANVAPTVTLIGDATADEGETKTYSFTVVDPGDETFTIVTATCGANGTKLTESIADATGTGAIQCKFPDGPASSTVSVEVSDGAASATDSVTVTVNNVAPVVTLTGAATADEGETKTYNFTVVDPGDETFSIVSATCGANGNKLNQSIVAATGAGTIQCKFPDGPATSIVSIEVSDETATDTDSLSVTVANVAPTVAFTAGPTTADESGVTEHTYSYSISDPGDDTITSVSTSCGTGGVKVADSDANNNTTGTFKCRFPDGPATPTVTAQATDSDGEAGNTAQRSVTVNNVAPTVTLTGDAAADEGQTKTYTYTVTDPGDDPNPTITESCGTNATLVNTMAANHFQCTFPEGPATSEVKVTANDGDATNNVGSHAIVVTIANVAPTATLANNGPVNEGSAVTVSFSGQSDPSAVDTAAGFKYSFNCDNNPGALAATYAAAAASASASCTFGDNGSVTVVARIFDEDDGYNDYTTQVTVNNVAPTLNAPTFSFNPYTGAAAAGISFSDPGWLDVASSSFNWAGTTTGGLPATIGPGSAPGPLTGSFGGTYTFGAGCITAAIGVTVSDDNAGASSHQFAAANTLGLYTVAFMAPLKDGARNVVKHGNVIPVKVSIRDCSGNAVLNRTLTIWLYAGVLDGHDIEDGTELVATSVSSADTTGYMRIADSHYMYNLATKGLTINHPYTIVIKDGTQVIATAVIDAKK